MEGLVAFAEQYVDVNSILSKAGYDKSLLFSISPSPSTTAVIAVLLAKMTSPVRVALDAVMVPLIVRGLRLVGVMQPELPVNQARLGQVISEIERLDNKYQDIDLEPAVKAIRRRAAKKTARRNLQVEKYTERKINKVLKKKKAGKTGS